MELRHPNGITVRDRNGVRERDLRQLMRGLAELDVRPHQLLSLTLDTRWRDEQQRERVRLFVKEEARRLRSGIGGGPGQALLMDLERAAEIVDERINAATAAGGLALYLSGAAGVELELVSAWPLRPRMAVGPRPILRPLVEGLRDPGRALVAVVDARATRVYALSASGSELTVGLERDVPRRHRSGGWSQLSIQHHRDERLDQHHRDAAAEIARRFDEERGPRVLLGGRQESVANLVGFLPERVRQRLARVEALDTAMAEDRVVDAAVEALGRLLLEEGVQRLRALDELQSVGRAATEIGAVLAALNENRVARLYLSERLCQDGWSCPRCGVVGEGLARDCADCGAEVDAVELGEAMSVRALRQAADVEVVEEATGIGRRGGAAAELRYPTLH